MPNALPDAAVDRFLSDIRQISGLTGTERFGLCVSGGPDSLALLLLVHAARLNFEVATVDHGLRPASATEANGVAQLCTELSCTHEVLTLSGGPTGNVSDWARTERYRALIQWADERNLEFLLTAHHADDQLETILMRLNRGSGVAGLAGIRTVNGLIVRPLLGWRKTELTELVADAGLIAVDDPSNRNDKFDRSRLRKHLSEADWLDPIAAVRSAQALSEAEEALQWATDQVLLNRLIEVENGLTLSPASLPRELLRRITVECLQRINPQSAPRGAELDRLVAALKDSKIATLSGVKATGGATWRFTHAAARRKSSSK
jgi:tRNA(Ile)-lysidine synthase